LLHDKANDLCPKHGCFIAAQGCFMAKQTVFVPNTIASGQSRSIRDEANCYGTKHGCFMTMQIDARQSKRPVHQTRLLHDKGVLLRDKANG
jgi:hypothetical protein